MTEEVETKIKLPPRIHCFDGPRVSLSDICGKLECTVIECLWHRDRGHIPSSLGADNRTDALPKIG